MNYAASSLIAGLLMPWSTAALAGGIPAGAMNKAITISFTAGGMPKSPDSQVKGFTDLLKRTAVCLGLLSTLAMMGVSTANAGVVLITPEEAKLPAPKQIADSRAITRGPRIEISDIDDGKLQSPLHFKLKFRSYGGSSIDVGSVTVTYLRSPNVDLTERVKPYLRSTGIDIPDAEVPPGEHAIRIDLKDSEGRSANTSFLLAVAPN
jgi:hypothetical protein